MSEGVIPTKAAWARVSGAVTRLENTPVSNVGTSPRRAANQYREFWAEITGSTQVADVWQHAWEERVRDATGFVDGGQGRSGDVTDSFAVSISGARISDGAIVRMFLDFNGDGDPFWTAEDASGSGIFPVTLTQDGGTNGDLTTAATYTYTCTDLNSTDIAFGLSPQWPRALGRCNPGTNGIGYYASAGEFILCIAFEVRDTGDCST